MRLEVGPVIALGLAALLAPATAGRAADRDAKAVQVASTGEASAVTAAGSGAAAKSDKATKAGAGAKVATLDKSAGAGAAAVTRPAPPQKHIRPKAASPAVVARIDLSSQRMHVSVNGQTVGSWKISSGRSGYLTPTGRFRPTWTSRMHYSRKYDNSPMPYSVFFNGGIATHGTGAVSRLGQAASHGCIRLTKANARTFYNLVHKYGKNRTRIVVTGHAPQPSYAARKSSRSRTASRPANAFQAEARSNRRRSVYGGQRLSVYEYERRYQARVRRYQQHRRKVWPGDAY